MKILFSTLICFAFIQYASGQKLIALTDVTITINPRNHPAGYTDVVDVPLPLKTQSFVYRISIFKKNQWKAAPSLSVLLDSMGAKNVAQTTDFKRFIVSNNDNTMASAFIFSNPTDAENFYLNQGRWRACKNLLRITSTCQSSVQCLGKKLYFGISNGDIEEVDVRLEVVAVVE